MQLEDVEEENCGLGDVAGLVWWWLRQSGRSRAVWSGLEGVVVHDIVRCVDVKDAVWGLWLTILPAKLVTAPGDNRRAGGRRMGI